jgi:tRNA dimethylallyltransferase
MKKIIVIYGPTGSGKTNLSNLIAQGNNFNIVNIDAMQVYDKIKILNASPEDSDKKLINHSLFNFFSVYF